MKAVHIASGDLWAGAEAQIYLLARALQQLPALEVSVILMNSGELESRLRRAGIPVVVLDESQLGVFGIAWRLFRYLYRLKPDIVHTHRNKENVLGSIAALLAGSVSLRSVHGRDEDDSAFWRLDKRLTRFLDWLCGRYLQQCVVAVSGQLAEELARRFPRRRLETIENGIDSAELALAASGRAMLVTAKGRIRIGFVGRLVPVKRIDLFLQAAKMLCEHSPAAFDFHIIGDGPQRALCERMVAESGLSDCVHLYGFRTDATALMAQLDVLLLTSDHEGLPMTLLEAMSLEVSIVASAVGGIPHVLANGGYGGLVHDQRAQAYADAIRAMLASPGGRAQQLQDAAAHVRRHYSVSHTAARYADIYRRLCPNAAASSTEADPASGESSGV
jgi:glycosyltransferase involved in cell wall biosynthesis